jgi:hypothetical protein
MGTRERILECAIYEGVISAFQIIGFSTSGLTRVTGYFGNGENLGSRFKSNDLGVLRRLPFNAEPSR